MTSVSYSITAPLKPFTNSNGSVSSLKSGITSSRASSGGNRPKVSYQRKYWSYTDSRQRVRVRAGKKFTTIVVKTKLRWYRSRVGVDPKHFSEPHDYSRTSSKSFIEPYILDVPALPGWYGAYWSYSDFGSADWSGLTLSTWNSDDELALIGKLRAKLGGEFDPGVFLAELPEALSMIRNSASRISRAYSSYKKGNAIKAWNLLTDSKPYKKFGVNRSSNWLELQYGWLPLLSDAHSGAEFIAHHFSDVPPKQVVRVSSSRNGKFVKPTSAGAYRYGLASHTTRVGYKATISENNLPTLTGMIDPLTMAWEKLPYSFVIDWFLPVGDYLSARGLAQRVSGTFERTVLVKKIGKNYGRNNQPPGGTTYRGGLLDFEGITFTRTVSGSLSVPLPSFKPLLSVPSWGRAANAVALLLQKVY